MTISITNYSALDGRYTVHGTIGSGGFGKVKKGIHVVTGEKVAIKVMDKRTLGDDLPRVKLEIQALKDLCHQNICKMYEVVETDSKIFMILEHCSGGEMFDYIVERDRLQESEARFFFRQIVAAIAYIHSQGYAHRDLKPENLLLDENQNIKVIDFGLCARPKGGMGVQLETFCGSPAYAAPELIIGKEYLGSEVDIWSLGILLFTLLCGYLPFDDENVGSLYRKIQSGSYECPPWLSDGSKNMISRMLQTDPKRRITVNNLLIHPWLTQGNGHIHWKSVYDKEDFHDEVVSELALYFARSKKSIHEELKQWKYDYLMSTYFLLKQKKKRGLFFSLAAEEMPLKQLNHRVNRELTSSLESGLNDAELLLLASPKRNSDSLNKTPVSSEDSLIVTVPNQQVIQRPPTKGPTSQPSAAARVTDKENFALPSCPPSTKKTKRTAPRTPVTRAQPPEMSSARESPVPVSTPRAIGPGKTGSRQACREGQIPEWFQSPALFTPIEKRSRSVDLDLSGHGGSSDQSREESSSCPVSIDGTPARSGSARNRVFGSIEKGMDRVRNMLTPRRKGDLPTHPILTSPAGTPRRIKVKSTGLYNVSVVGSSNKEKSPTPDAVLDTLQKALESKGIPCNRKGFTLRNKIRNEQTGKVTLAFELEICSLQQPSNATSGSSRNTPLLGVCRKRLKGDAWMYKNVVEEVLKVLNHSGW